VPFLPKQAADVCIRRARRFLQLAESALPIARAKNDLRRMALVMAVAAVDSYMHGIVIRRIGHVRRRGDLPKALARLEIPFSEFAELADASIEAQRAKQRTRPWVQVKGSLQRRLLKDTFQSYEQVATAFSIAGVEKAWSKIASKLGQPTEKIRERLNSLVYRRNQIAHEGDMKRASRPQRMRFNDTAHAQVEQDVDWVAALIDAMDDVVAKDS
jgi:hypothetical protein